MEHAPAEPEPTEETPVAEPESPAEPPAHE
jgi:hypothetical protein